MCIRAGALEALGHKPLLLAGGKHVLVEQVWSSEQAAAARVTGALHHASGIAHETTAWGHNFG